MLINWLGIKGLSSSGGENSRQMWQVGSKAEQFTFLDNFSSIPIVGPAKLA